jgi:hypothetical protein
MPLANGTWSPENHGRSRLQPFAEPTSDEDAIMKVYKLACGLAASIALTAFADCAQADQPPETKQGAARDGQHDFDFEIGTWKTHVKRLQHPLTGSSTWVDYDGTSIVSKVLDGRANLVELRVEGAAGRIDAISLRLYNPQARQWSLNFSNIAGGTLSQPTIGEFHDGRGEFYDQETLADRAIFVRFIITPIDKDTWRFEQAFSADGGKSWEANWIATDKRVTDTGG